MSMMSSLVYEWLVSAGDENLAEKFKEKVSPDPLPPNSLRLADLVKIYQKENISSKRKAGHLMSSRDAKKARKEDVPSHDAAKPAAQKKKNLVGLLELEKSSSEKEDSSDEEEKAQLGAEISPEMAENRKDSNSDDGKVVIPDAKMEESISDDDSIVEEEKAKPGVKQVQLVDLKSSSESSDDDSIVEEENPQKTPGENIQIVVLESSSDSSDDEEDKSEQVGSTKGTIDIVSPDADAAKKMDQNATEKVGKSPMCTEETTQQKGCRVFVRGVTQDVNIVDLQSAFEAHGRVLDVYNSKKGFAFVTFSKASEATAAIVALDKQLVCGFSVNVSLAKPRKNDGGRRARGH